MCPGVYLYYFLSYNLSRSLERLYLKSVVEGAWDLEGEVSRGGLHLGTCTKV